MKPPADWLFYEPVNPTRAEIDAAEREADNNTRMARTLLDLIMNDPQLRSFVEDYARTEVRV